MTKKKLIYRFIFGLHILGGITSIAQNKIFQNNGILQVKQQTILSSHSDFLNSSNGFFTNDGVVYYFGDFSNEGNFTYTQTQQTGEVFFVDNQEDVKIIKGLNVVTLNKVTFDNNRKSPYFDLKVNLDIWGELSFKNGIIKVDSTWNLSTQLPNGMVSFMPKSKHSNSNAYSFIDGQVEKIGADAFDFPIGNKGKYRPATISAPKSSKDIILCSYRLDDNDFFTKHNAVVKEIKQINTKEYWLLKQAKKNPTEIVLTLSWDEETTPFDLLNNPEEELHIVYWNEKANHWEDLGGVVDKMNQKISTPTSIKDFGYFTLATVYKDNTKEEDLVIYNLVQPNGGGEKNYFYIENITKYPKNSVQIYNRWGEKVYETTNYDQEGNVFNGHQGRGTHQGKKLASGTYYYLLTYQKETDKTNYTVKKTGYLHLESN